MQSGIGDGMLFVTGDMHGEAGCLGSRIRAAEEAAGRPLREGDEILVLGDVGLRYGASEATGLLSAMMRARERTGVRFVAMRGNHDARYCRDLRNGSYGRGFHEEGWLGGTVLVDDRTDAVMYLPDEGGVFDAGGHAIAVVPGAYSVDRDFRLRMRWPYEWHEQLTAAEMDALLGAVSGAGVEIVLSHTCPASWLPLISDLFLEGLDQSRVDKGMERFLDALLGEVSGTCRGWWFGHYHDNRDVGDELGIGHMLLNGVVALPLSPEP